MNAENSREMGNSTVRPCTARPADMVDKLEKIWMDGKLVDWDDAKVHILTHSLHYGLGAFEGIRAYKRADGQSMIFRLREHVDRLFDSTRLVLMQMPFTREQLITGCV